MFALGCVLYEMSTGKRAFEGKSAASVVATIMNTEPAPVATIAPLTPPALEWAITKCLAKDPEERWQNAGDLASELRWIQEAGSRAGVAVPSAVRSRRKLLRAAVLAAVVAGAIVLGFFLKQAPMQPVLRVAINLPPGTEIVPGSGSALAPDGQRVLLTLADAQGKAKLWVRELSTDAALPLEGTEGAIYPFWSPDSRFIGFFSVDGKVRKMAAGGGPAEAVCDVWQIAGGTWGRNDVIVFSTGSKGLYKVPASGGTPVRIPTPENDGSDYRMPSFLPDGKHLLVSSYAGAGGIFVVSLDTGEVQPVLPNEPGPAQYAEPGYILFPRGDNLMAQPFDVRSLRVSASARPVAESVANLTMSYSASAAGLLLYQHAFQTQLTWFDSEGNKLSTIGDPGFLTAPYISPNGKYAMVEVTDPRHGRKSFGSTTSSVEPPIRLPSVKATTNIPHGLRMASRLHSVQTGTARKTSTSKAWRGEARSNCCSPIRATRNPTIGLLTGDIFSSTISEEKTPGLTSGLCHSSAIASLFPWYTVRQTRIGAHFRPIPGGCLIPPMKPDARRTMSSPSRVRGASCRYPPAAA